MRELSDSEKVIFDTFVWTLKRWQLKITPEEMAQALIESPCIQDLLNTYNATFD